MLPNPEPNMPVNGILCSIMAGTHGFPALSHPPIESYFQQSNTTQDCVLFFHCKHLGCVNSLHSTLPIMSEFTLFAETTVVTINKHNNIFIILLCMRCVCCACVVRVLCVCCACVVRVLCVCVCMCCARVVRVCVHVMLCACVLCFPPVFLKCARYNTGKKRQRYALKLRNYKNKIVTIQQK